MKRLAASLKKFRAVAPADRWTLVTAAVCMPLFWLGLRLLGLPRFQALLERAPMAMQPAMSLGQIQALGNLVNIAARHTLGPSSCLTRSLLLGWMLRQRGVESKLRIGVSVTGGWFRAHAWVECGGIPVNDRPEIGAQFASFGDLVPLQAFRSR